MNAPLFRARTGIDNVPKSAFEATLLPDSEKEQLCVQLLGEFGVSVSSRTRDGELIHSCSLPGTRHKNGDKNASASINYKKLTFNCLGCGSSGGLLWWIATCRGEDSADAREWLATSTGTGGRTMDLTKFMDLIDALVAPREGPAPIPRYDPTVLDPWDAVHPYMTEIRGCRDEVLDEFRVCYAEDYPMGRDGAGRALPTQERIIIPLFWRGDLVGWQARALHKGDEPKYKNSPEFPKDRALYGLHEQPTSLVVESPLSVLRHRHHVPELVATFGASVTDPQVRLLHRHRRNILWFDNDPAGWKATHAVAVRLERHAQVFVVPSLYSADPADMDDETVRRLIGEAVPYAVWEQPRTLIPLES